jgi:HEAT repeat protein
MLRATVILVLLSFLVHFGDAEARKRAPMNKLTYDQAIKALASPSTWCDGAAELASLKDSRAIVPLVKAYEQKFEGSPAMCLLDALHAVAKGIDLATLLPGADDEARAALFHAMALVPNDGLIPALEQGTTDPNPNVHRQTQTAAWIKSMGRLLESPTPLLRRQAVESLGRLQNEQSRTLLREHLARESSPELKAQIERALGAL